MLGIITAHVISIVIIIALTRNNGYKNFNRAGIFVSKKVKFEVFLTWPLIYYLFYRQKLRKIIFAYLKNLISLICGFRIPDSGFSRLVFGFRFPGFRIAPKQFCIRNGHWETRPDYDLRRACVFIKIHKYIASSPVRSLNNLIRLVVERWFRLLFEKQTWHQNLSKTLI